MANLETRTKGFIEDSIKIHGNRYDYTKVVYVNAITYVIITCPVHGDFEQYPTHHRRGKGCMACFRESRRSNKDEFVKSSIKIYGAKFTYDKVVYIDNKNEVTITCVKHGDFSVTPNNHLSISSKGGCTKCKSDGQGIRNSVTWEHVMSRFIDKWGDKFTYYPETFTDVNSHIKIKCDLHGEFVTTPARHYRRPGCGPCGEKYKHPDLKYFYIASNAKRSILKIGVTKDPRQRNDGFVDFDGNGRLKITEFFPIENIDELVLFEENIKRLLCTFYDHPCNRLTGWSESFVIDGRFDYLCNLIKSCFSDSLHKMKTKADDSHLRSFIHDLKIP